MASTFRFLGRLALIPVFAYAGITALNITGFAGASADSTPASTPASATLRGDGVGGTAGPVRRRLRHGREIEKHAVRTSAGDTVEVDVSGWADADRNVGKHVQLKGHREGSVFVALDGAATSGSTTSMATVAGIRSTAVILLNFTNDGTQPWTTAAASSLMFEHVLVGERLLSRGVAWR